MKCDELKRFDIVGKYTDDETIGECYDADEVDEAIAEIKAENRKLQRALWLARAERAKMEIHREYPYEWCEGSKKCWEKCVQLCRAKAEEYT